MVSETVQIIKEILGSHLTADGVCTYISNGLIKYVIHLQDYVLEIQYEFADNFYRVRLEEWQNNQIAQTYFLSKSKKFHKVLKKNLRDNGLYKKRIECHITCLCKIVHDQLNTPKGLHDFKALYISDMKFDGVFL